VAAISLATTSPNVLVVHPSLPVKSVKELVVYAKGKPGELNYASSGIGASDHLAAELFRSMAGVDIVRINLQCWSRDHRQFATGIRGYD